MPAEVVLVGQLVEHSPSVVGLNPRATHLLSLEKRVVLGVVDLFAFVLL